MPASSVTYRSLDGKTASEAIRNEIAAQAARITQKRGRAPHLAAVLIGDDGASRTYVENKVKACEKAGFQSTLVRGPNDITEQELLSIVTDLNNDGNIDGFIVQLPLPGHINSEKITLAIDPDKDVDGFHPVNVGRMVLGLPGFLPATPNGIIQLLKYHNIETAGKHCVVVGRSNIVGTPMSILMSRNSDTANCTVTLAHSRTKDLASFTRSADILIVAIGKPAFIKEDMVKQGAIVIDVGIHRIEDRSRSKGYRLIGDVDFATVAHKCSMITPVPGGVGPMTITSLLLNTLKAAEVRMNSAPADQE
ncbi:MAG: bifunctional methylenetetrahydrofolate dehydrogenase/methenyltetrahydrofolate cyclohydrolase FolD [Bacteroidota bacterium]|nr:bifunctional methylenetetrahydrofolate dehydrogenase/methenyltetrahydrofolate cyclohydrolase FolD [Bacteroidota bacterium]